MTHIREGHVFIHIYFYYMGYDDKYERNRELNGGLGWSFFFFFTAQ